MAANLKHTESGGAGTQPYTVEEVLALTKLNAACDLCEDHGIDYDDVTTLAEAKDLLLKHIGVSSDDIAEPHQYPGSALFQQLLKKDEELRQELALIFKLMAGRLWNSLNSDIKTSLNAIEENFQDKLVQQMSLLNNAESPILVAGETGSGKSSLLNLLLGEDVLPYSVLSCTSTLCEVRYGPKKASVHIKREGGKRGSAIIEDFDLSGPDQSYQLEELSKYMARDRTSENPTKDIVEKVEICWPLDMLKNNVVIVDSPGIGESDEMDQRVLKYLDKAFAFIYVINSANAGGVQEDRIQRLLRKVANSTPTDDGLTAPFDQKSAIFVFNKWDQVPDEEKEEVKGRTKKRLLSCWSGLDEGKIFYMSVTEVSRQLKLGVREPVEFQQLLGGIAELIPRSMKNKITIYYQYLAGSLSRINQLLNVRIVNAKKEVDEKRQGRRIIKERLKRLRFEVKEIMQDLRDELRLKSDVVTSKIRSHIKSEAVIQRLGQWNESKLPDADNMQDLTLEAQRMIENILYKELVRLEQEEQYFAEAKEYISQRFQEKFGYIESKLNWIENAISCGDIALGDPAMRDVPTDSNLFDLHAFSAVDKAVLAIAAPLWIPLALIAGIFALPIVGGLAVREKFRQAGKLEEYRADKVKWMNVTLRQYIDQINKEYTVKSLVDKQLKSLHKVLSYFEDRIPKLIKEDEEEQDRMKKDKRTRSEQLKEFNPMKEKCEDIESELLLFFYRGICTTYLPGESLHFDTRSHIGFGSFGDVYAIDIDIDGVRSKVAMKRMRALNEYNVATFYTEENALRKLVHRNIVKFVGTFYENGQDGERLSILMEFCHHTLSRLLLDDDCRQKRIPAMNESIAQIRAAYRFSVDMARQLSEALSYLHRHTYIHRDLKTDNVLVTKDWIVKLADVGLTKRKEDISGTVCGTSLYMAPEVYAKASYDHKADMYSFAMILYELWYGKRIFSESEFGTMGLHEIMNKIMAEEPLRPEIDDDLTCDLWKEMMTSCWHRDPRKRPTSETCCTQLKMASSDYFIEEHVPRRTQNHVPTFGPVTVHSKADVSVNTESTESDLDSRENSNSQLDSFKSAESDIFLTINPELQTPGDSGPE